MRYRNSDDEGGERRPESTRSVALHDEQVRGWAQQREQGVANNLDVSVRINFARAAEVSGRIGLHPELGRIEPDVLVGEH
jgi:hypothetical protein